jgi:hypothetical protein
MIVALLVLVILNLAVTSYLVGGYLWHINVTHRPRRSQSDIVAEVRNKYPELFARR